MTQEHPSLEVVVDDADPDELRMVLVGELDMVTCKLLREAFEHAESTGRMHVLLDLSGLTFIDSTGLSAVYEAHKLFEEAGTLVIAPAPTAVQRVIDVSGLTEVLRFSESDLAGPG